MSNLWIALFSCYKEIHYVKEITLEIQLKVLEGNQWQEEKLKKYIFSLCCQEKMNLLRGLFNVDFRIGLLFCVLELLELLISMFFRKKLKKTVDSALGEEGILGSGIRKEVFR